MIADYFFVQLRLVVKRFCTTLCCGLVSSRYWAIHRGKKNDFRTAVDEPVEPVEPDDIECGFVMGEPYIQSDLDSPKHFEVIVFDDDTLHADVHQYSSSV
jgi:hypothetical protein